MKLNIVRAWKDEIYRQSLSNEQMDMLPTNPVGELELTDTSLQFIYGTGGGPGGGGAGGGGVAPGVGIGFGGRGINRLAGRSGTSASNAFEENFHSLAVTCNETAFSITSSHGFSVLSPITPICINEQED